jgi:hypothetical protein
MKRISCDCCGCGHNSREGERRCHAKAIYDADVERMARSSQGPKIGGLMDKISLSLTEQEARTALALCHIGQGLAMYAGDAPRVGEFDKLRSMINSEMRDAGWAT